MENLAGLRVLLVEDELLTLELFEFTLSLQNAEVRTARNVAQAMQLMQSWSPQVIVTDIGLPDMDGYSFIQALREEPSTQAIPVVVLSGYVSNKTETSDDARVIKIAKPVDPDHLVRVIANAAK